MKTRSPHQTIHEFAGWLILSIAIFGCQWILGAPSSETSEKTTIQTPEQNAAFTATLSPTIPVSTDTSSKTTRPSRTVTCTKTPRPKFTDTPEYQSPCVYAGPPAAFEPAGIPEILTQSDAEVFRQTSWWTETDVYFFQSYGGASYGTVTKVHSVCHEDLPKPDILSYCKYETETSRIHVMSGEVQGTPQKTVNESFVRGRQGWVRMNGGDWTLNWNLTDSDVEKAAEAYKNSPFFYEEVEDCQPQEDFPGTNRLCFKVNLPRFMESVYGEEISFVDCVVDNLGILWTDPQTHLPKQLTIAFNSAMTYQKQGSNEEPYNILIEMKTVFKGFNVAFTYPNP